VLPSHPDHVAIVVPDIPAALARWQDVLHGTHQWDFHNPARFRGKVLAFTGGGKLEMLMPSDETTTDATLGGPTGFVEAFLARFGTRVHHVTLKVPDLLAAVDLLRAAGVEPVDVNTSDDDWHEAFVPPSVVGGMIVQVAPSARSDAEWSAANGETPAAPSPDGPVLRGPTLTHPDLDRAREVWSLLGADVADDGADALVARWEGHPLDVRIQHGERAGAVGLRFRGTGPRPLDPTLGPPVLAER
jgi:catechol 2,3-dioxygenase-like lactoylglutathione lyase family enzyme